MNNSKRFSIIAVIVIVLIACVATPLSLSRSTAAANSDNDPLIVVSLGDSYSSGEGVEPFYNQNEPVNFKIYDVYGDWIAHRSEKSWPGKISFFYHNKLIKLSDYHTNDVNSNADIRWYFRASSGATTESILGPQLKKVRGYKDPEWNTVIDDDVWLPTQLRILDDINKVMGKGSIDYVTITIGGNDVEFSGILESCILNDTFIDFGWLTGKDQLQDKLQELLGNVSEIEQRLVHTYMAIEDEAGKQAAITVAGYPKLVRGTNNIINPLEAELINMSVTYFNSIIKRVVEEKCHDKMGMNIYYVDVETAFDGHEAYLTSFTGLKGDWINPLILRKDQDINQTSFASAYSFHPNDMGTSVYAECVSKKIQEIENKKEANKTPSPSPTATQEPTSLPTATTAPTSTPTPTTTPPPTPTPTFAPTPTATTTHTPTPTPTPTSPYIREGDYVYFGSYPQSEVEDENLKNTLSNLAGSTSEWTSFDYYINGVASDFMVYKDISYNGQKYRGVYFTSYRPYYSTMSSSADYSKQDDNGYNTNTIYWFKFEPAKWRILSETDDDLFLFSDKVLDAQDFYHYPAGQTTGDYTNSYEKSYIRIWLSEVFYNTAFSEQEKGLIKDTVVDNSIDSSLASEYHPYEANDTVDRVFLLSYSEVHNSRYGFVHDTSANLCRVKYPTAYSLVQGVLTSGADDWWLSYTGGSPWWLRSPTDSYQGVQDCTVYAAAAVYFDGKTDGGGLTYITDYGVVPALHIYPHNN